MASFLGPRLAYTDEVVTLVPLERLVMRTGEGPFPRETTSTWAAVDAARTRMTLRNRGEPSGFAGLVAGVLSRAMRPANRNDLARLRASLKTLLGAPGSSRPAR